MSTSRKYTFAGCLRCSFRARHAYCNSAKPQRAAEDRRTTITLLKSFLTGRLARRVGESVNHFDQRWTGCSHKTRGPNPVTDLPLAGGLLHCACSCYGFLLAHFRPLLPRDFLLVAVVLQTKDKNKRPKQPLKVKKTSKKRDGARDELHTTTHIDSDAANRTKRQDRALFNRSWISFMDTARFLWRFRSCSPRTAAGGPW